MTQRQRMNLKKANESGKVAKELVDLSLIEQSGERPVYYSMKKKYFEEE